MTVHFSQLTHLGDLPIAHFLRDYWQQKPLLIRQAFTDLPTFISPDELAGLSLEEDVTTRLIHEDHAKGQWQVRHGPFSEHTYAELPESHWSLLVQHVDSLDPQLNSLINAFRFIPNWRLDDIMANYSTDGGGVGPHFDYFDVFLLQTEGKKHWRLGQVCDASSPLRPDQAMKLLSQFDTVDEWVVEPGDLLYIPAHHAHWGVSLGQSTTLSIGFRAPSAGDILLDYSQELAAQTHEDQRYRDPHLSPQHHCGEITSSAHDNVKAILEAHYNNDAKLQCWLGEYSTQLKQEINEQLTPIATKDLNNIKSCALNRFCRCAFSTVDGKTLCFINGCSWECSRELAMTLSNYHPFTPAAFTDGQDKKVLAQWASEGFLEISE